MTATRRVVALCIAALLVAAVALMVVMAMRATTDSSAEVGTPHPDVETILNDPAKDRTTAEQEGQALQAQHNEEQLRKEYASAAGQLPALPVGWAVDVDTRAAELYSADTADPAAGIPVYEEGFFASLYAIDWQCAWVDEAIEAQKEGDDARMEHALATFEGFANSRLAFAFPDFETVFAPTVSSAIRLGDMRTAMEWRNTIC